MSEQSNEMWATVELMGHVLVAGRVSRPSDWGGLLRVDIPHGDSYQTELIGTPAIYRIKFVSEEIARSLAAPDAALMAYDTPIVTREQHEHALYTARQRMVQLEQENRELQRRLTSINALPGPVEDEIDDQEGLDDDDGQEDDEF